MALLFAGAAFAAAVFLAGALVAAAFLAGAALAGTFLAGAALAVPWAGAAPYRCRAASPEVPSMAPMDALECPEALATATRSARRF
jgi:hypothetical protein